MHPTQTPAHFAPYPGLPRLGPRHTPWPQRSPQRRPPCHRHRPLSRRPLSQRPLSQRRPPCHRHRPLSQRPLSQRPLSQRPLSQRSPLCRPPCHRPKLTISEPRNATLEAGPTRPHHAEGASVKSATSRHTRHSLRPARAQLRQLTGPAIKSRRRTQVQTMLVCKG